MTDLLLTSPTVDKPKLKSLVLVRVGYRCTMAIAFCVLAQQWPEGSQGRERLMRKMREHAAIMAKIGTPQERKRTVRDRRTT